MHALSFRRPCRLNADLRRQADSSLSKANRATQVGRGGVGIGRHLHCRCSPLSALLCAALLPPMPPACYPHPYPTHA